MGEIADSRRASRVDDAFKRLCQSAVVFIKSRRNVTRGDANSGRTRSQSGKCDDESHAPIGSVLLNAMKKHRRFILERNRLSW